MVLEYIFSILCLLLIVSFIILMSSNPKYDSHHNIRNITNIPTPYPTKFRHDIIPNLRIVVLE